MTQTSEVAAAFRTRAERFLEVVAQVRDDGWDRPSPCEEWTVRDVVGHVVDSERDIVTRVDLTLPEGRSAADDPYGAATDTLAAMQDVLDDPALAQREYEGAFGTTTLAQTISTFFVFDLVVHRWDVATGAGIDNDLDEDELDQIERSLDTSDSLYQYGACKRLDAPADADRRTRVLARLGRLG